MEDNDNTFDDESQDEESIKVVLIGESGVGKTSILIRYSSNEFKSNQLPTISANFISKTVILDDDNNTGVKFEIWDTAGQEKYRSLAILFYKNAGVCVFVYAITRKSSFKALKSFWINEVKNNITYDCGK